EPLFVKIRQEFHVHAALCGRAGIELHHGFRVVGNQQFPGQLRAVVTGNLNGCGLHGDVLPSSYMSVVYCARLPPRSSSTSLSISTLPSFDAASATGLTRCAWVRVLMPRVE